MNELSFQIILLIEKGRKKALIKWKSKNGDRKCWPRKKKEQVFALIPHSFKLEYGRATLLFLWICAKENTKIQPSCALSLMNI